MVYKDGCWLREEEDLDMEKRAYQNAAAELVPVIRQHWKIGVPYKNQPYLVPFWVLQVLQAYLEEQLGDVKEAGYGNNG